MVNRGQLTGCLLGSQLETQARPWSLISRSRAGPIPLIRTMSSMDENGRRVINWAARAGPMWRILSRSEMDALFMSTWPAPQEPAGGGAGAGVGAGRGVAVGGGNGVAVGCGVFVGVGVKVAAGVGTGVTVGRDVGTGDGAGVAVGKGVGAGEGAETGGAGGGTGVGVEEAGPSADSKPEAPAGWGVAVGFRALDGTTDGEDATVGWGDAVGEGTGIAAAAGVTGNNGEMSGRINNPANI